MSYRRLAAAAALLIAAAAPTQAQQPLELKVSHYMPPSETVHLVLEDWAKELERRSGGRLKLRIYPASQLGPVQRQFDLARNGQADMAVGLTGATPGRYPLTEIASLPFAAPSTGATSAAMSRRLTELGPKYLAGEFQGLHLLWLGMTPEVSFFTSKREIDGEADLRGLKMRFQGEGNAKILRRFGAVPLQVPPGDVADAMGKGVIDGALFNYEAAESYGLTPVTRHVMEPGFVAATLILVMNAERYDALPPDLRAIIDDTTGPAAAAELGRRWDEAEQHGRQSMLAANVKVNTLSPDGLAHLKETLKALEVEEVAALDKTGKPASQFYADFTR